MEHLDDLIDVTHQGLNVGVLCIAATEVWGLFPAEFDGSGSTEGDTFRTPFPG